MSDDLVQRLRSEFPPWDPRPLMREAADEIVRLQADNQQLRQAVWTARGILGFDNDGDTAPHIPHEQLVRMIVEEAQLERHQHDLAVNDSIAAEARVVRLQQALRDLADAEDDFHVKAKQTHDSASAHAFLASSKARDRALAAARAVLNGDHQ